MTPSPVRTALHARLAGFEPLTGLLSSPASIWHRRAPREARPPFVLFHKQAGNPRWTFREHTQWDLWLVKAVDRGLTAERAEAIAKQIDVCLNDHELTITGHRLLVLRRESDVSYPEPDGADLLHHEGGLYRLVTQPA